MGSVRQYHPSSTEMQSRYSGRKRRTGGRDVVYCKSSRQTLQLAQLSQLPSLDFIRASNSHDLIIGKPRIS